MKKNGQTENFQYKKWYDKGYDHGWVFARQEADYEELAAVARQKSIPVQWDIFRAEILNQYLDTPTFKFNAYSDGFGKACREFFDSI